MNRTASGGRDGRSDGSSADRRVSEDSGRNSEAKKSKIKCVKVHVRRVQAQPNQPSNGLNCCVHSLIAVYLCACSIVKVTPVPAESRVHVRDRRGSCHRSSHGRSGCRHQICGDAQRASGDTLLLQLLLFAQINCSLCFNMQCVLPQNRRAMQPQPSDISPAGKTGITFMRASAVSLCILHVLLLSRCVCSDQVPAWWCLDPDSFMPWVGWPTPT